jgi:hypothetical protein
VVGGSSHKKHKKKKPTVEADPVDANAEILDHKSREAKESSRRETLRQEVSLENVCRTVLNHAVAPLVNARCIREKEEAAGKVYCMT